MYITRRNFIKTGAAGTGLLIGGGLSRLYAQDAGGEESSLKSDQSFPLNPALPVPPDELRVLAGYIHHYRPPAGVMERGGGWTAVYDILQFSFKQAEAGRAPAVAMSNEVLGQVAVSCLSGLQEYRIRMDYRPTNAIEKVAATIRCNRDELASIRDYELVWICSNVNGGYTRRETGTVLPGELRVSFDSFTDVFKLSNSPVCLWTLLDTVRFLPEDSGSVRMVDLFMDLTAMRPDQRIAYSGNGTVHAAAGETPLRFYEQTGTGVEPIHYAVDKQDRTLFVTQGQLGWGLSRIERI